MARPKKDETSLPTFQGTNKPMAVTEVKAPVITPPVVQDIERTIPIPKPETMQWFVDLLNGRDEKKILIAIGGMLRVSARIDWWDPKDILDRMLQVETHGKNRQNIIKSIQEANSSLAPAGLTSKPFDPQKFSSYFINLKYTARKLGG